MSHSFGQSARSIESRRVVIWGMCIPSTHIVAIINCAIEPWSLQYILPLYCPMHVILTLLCVGYILRNTKMHLYFVSFVETETVKVNEIHLLGRENHAYTVYLIMSISWLLIAWWCNEPGHQQQCNWPSFCGIFCWPHKKVDLVFMKYLPAPTKRVNSSPPSAAYMHQWIGSALVQIMACRLFGAKPLSKTMLAYCQLDY